MSKVGLQTFTSNFVNQYLRSNPTATQEQTQVALKNELETLKNGGAKISAKDFAKANAMTEQAYKAAITQLPKTTAESVAKVIALETPAAYKGNKTGSALDHYYQFNELSKKARKNLHERNLKEGKAAFANDEYLTFLKEKYPELYKEQIKEQNIVSNNQAKKAANKEYLSSKDIKKSKKAAEQASLTENKSFRRRLGKRQRNLEYMTSQGLMTPEAKIAYQDALKRQQPFKYIEYTPQIKSAKDSMQVFIEKGLVTPVSQTASNTANTAKTAAKTAESAAKGTEKAVVETLSKGGSKGKIAAIAIGLIALAAGYLGLSREEKPEAEIKAPENFRLRDVA